MTALFQAPPTSPLSADIDDDFDFSYFVHDGDLNVVLGTVDFGLEESSPELDVEKSWCLATDDVGDSAGNAVPTLQLADLTVEESVDPPVQSESGKFADVEVVKVVWEPRPSTDAEMEIENKCRNLRMKLQKELLYREPHQDLHRTPDAIDTRTQSEDLNYIELIARQSKTPTRVTQKIPKAGINPREDEFYFKGRAGKSIGIGGAVDATSRLETALGTSEATHPSAHLFKVPTKTQLRRETTSESQGVAFSVRTHGGVRDRDLGETSRSKLASPFQTVYRQPMVIDLTEDDESETATGRISATGQGATPTSRGQKLHSMSDDSIPISKKRERDSRNDYPAVLVPMARKRAKRQKEPKVSAQGHADLQTAFMKPVVEITITGMAEFNAEIKDVDEARHKFLTAGMKCSPQQTMNFLEANTKAREVALRRKDMWSKVLQHLDAWDVKDKEVTAQLESSR